MSVNDYKSAELISQRKKVSDNEDYGDQLSIPESGKKNSGKQAGAYLKSRTLRDRLDLENIILSKDDETYFNDLMDE